MPDVLKLRWRVGRKTGRTLWAIVWDEASDDDILLGMVDDYGIAARIVADHNAMLVAP